MNPLFADWHRDTSVDLATVDLEARAAAADSLAEATNSPGIMVLVAAAFGQPVNEDDDAFLRKPFKEAETSFPMRGNDKELRMLAAAVLEAVCRREDDKGVLAGYAVRVAGLRGWTCALPETVEAAELTLAELGETRRTAPARPTAKRGEPWTDALKDSLEGKLGAVNYVSPAAALDAFEAALRAAAAQSAAAAAHADAIGGWCERRLALASEESALLWWLLSGTSRTLDAPWTALSPETAAVAAGRELAGLAAVLPEPPQAAALLRQLVAATPKPRKPEDIPVPALDVPTRLAFLIAEPGGATAVEAGLHSMAQALLLRAWGAAG